MDAILSFKFKGDRCEVSGSCISEPCSSTGSCVQHSKLNHSCICDVGYTGQRCDELVDYCSSSPCINGGTCISLIGSFKCLCIPGFTGQFSKICAPITFYSIIL